MELSEVVNQIHITNVTVTSLQLEVQRLSRVIVKQGERISILEREMLAMRGFLNGTGSEHLADLQEGLKDI